MQLSHEGITIVDDLVEFDKVSIQQIVSSLRRPGGRIADPTPGAPAGSTIPQPPFRFGAKSQSRMEVACDLLRFYETIGRPVTAANLKWSTVMLKFGLLWKSLKARHLALDPVTPVISKELPIMKWCECFEDHLYRCVGVRMIPLSYVIRADVTCDVTCPTLKTDEPFSAEWGSIEMDLIVRASHAHPLYPQCCEAVYFKLEEACRATKYADSLKPFSRKKDGRGAFFALKAQYAGKDKWEAELKRCASLLLSRK